MEKRNRYTPEFKTKVVLEVLQEQQTVNEIAAKYEVSPVMVSRWKAEFMERASTVFDKKTSETEKMKKEYESKQEHLEKLVGQLTVEVDWLKKKIWPQMNPLNHVKPWLSVRIKTLTSSVRLSC